MRRSIRMAVAVMVSFLFFSLPLASAVYPPTPYSWTVHRGIPENQGIDPKSFSPITSHELWNNSSLEGSTCDPVAANVTTSMLGPVKENLLYTGGSGTIRAWNAWTGDLRYYHIDFTIGVINQILIDDPFIIVKTNSYILAYDTTLTVQYWKYHNLTFYAVPHVNETAGHIFDGMNRIQLMQHQVIAGVVNGSDSNYSIMGVPQTYSGHRAYRADYDIGELNCIWYHDLNSEVNNTPALYLNLSGTGYGGNNTTSPRYGHELPGYGTEIVIPPDFSPLSVGNKNVIYLTMDNWLYCLRVDNGGYSIIQNATVLNASLTNPRRVSDYIIPHPRPYDTCNNPVVVYHIKTEGNNSWGGGDGTWNGGQTIGCDVVYFLTWYGYANGICLWDFTGNFEGLYTWNEINFNFSGTGAVFLQSFAVDESLNQYNDNPLYNESYLFVGEMLVATLFKIKCSDGSIVVGIPFGGGLGRQFLYDSPIFSKGRLYVLMHAGGPTFPITIFCFDGNLNIIWFIQYNPSFPPVSNPIGLWNPEPCLAFDTVFVCAYWMTAVPNIWAQRDNEPPWVDCGENIIYPVIGQQYDFTNASCGDYDGTISNITWDFKWGERYTLVCNFTFWVHQSTTGYLNVTDDDGAMTSDSFTIIPQFPPAPVVNVTWDGWAVINTTDMFNGSNTTGTNITWYNWTVEAPNGTFWYDNGTNQTMTYYWDVLNDTFNVTLNVTDEWDQSDEVTVQVFVNFCDRPTITWISRPTHGFVGKALDYELSTENISFIIWLWGDGTYSNTTDGNASHSWGKWGMYDVTVTVYNIYGISNSTTFQVEIDIFDWDSFISIIFWILLIIIILLLIRYTIKVWTRDDYLDI